MFLSYIGECVEHPRNIGEFTGFLPGPEVVILGYSLQRPEVSIYPNSIYLVSKSVS